MGTLSKVSYILDTIQSTPAETSLLANTHLWHQRLSHFSTDGIRLMSENGTVKGINFSVSDKTFHCFGCYIGKGNRTQIPKFRSSRVSKLLEPVNSDVLGLL